MKKKILFLILPLILVGAGIFISHKTHSKPRTARKAPVSQERNRQAWLGLENNIGSEVRGFKGTVGVVIKDLRSNREIAFNKNVLMPSASVVKIPVMLSCFYAERDGKISLKDTVCLRGGQRVAGSKVLGDCPPGSRFTVEALLGPMITQSDNTAANVLIDLIGFDALNAYFRKMGLQHTNIVRNMMDFKERKAGGENYTTASDMAYLLEKLYRRQLLSKGISERCLGLLGGQKVNDRIPKKLPKEGVFIAHKTGLERYICHDVGIVYTKKGNFLICVLVRHEEKLAKSAKQLIADIALLVYNYYRDL